MSWGERSCKKYGKCKIATMNKCNCSCDQYVDTGHRPSKAVARGKPAMFDLGEHKKLQKKQKHIKKLGNNAINKRRAKRRSVNEQVGEFNDSVGMAN